MTSTRASGATRNGSTSAWRRRRAWWAARLPVPCVRCGQPVEPTDAWHLDHPVAWVDGGQDHDARPAHAACNLAAGRTPVDGVNGDSGAPVHVGVNGGTGAVLVDVAGTPSFGGGRPPD